MKEIETIEDIHVSMMGFSISAALTTALEKSIFWYLQDEKTDNQIAEYYKIPLDRTKAWLRVLYRIGLVEVDENSYRTSTIARKIIINKYSKDTWGLLAQETREKYHAIIDLPDHISHPTSVWNAQGIKNLNYIDKMRDDEQRAERFCRMLFEIHTPLAKQIAEKLDMTGINQLLDIGGGSGVISFALIRKHPNLHSTVFDMQSVTKAGKIIADEQNIHRITYLPGDFNKDTLPTGFDMVIECDVGIYNLELFTKILKSLNSNGRFIIFTNTNDHGAQLKDDKINRSLFSLSYSFISSLGQVTEKSQSMQEVVDLLNSVGFQDIRTDRFDEKITMIEAKKI